MAVLNSEYDPSFGERHRRWHERNGSCLRSIATLLMASYPRFITALKQDQEEANPSLEADEPIIVEAP